MAGVALVSMPFAVCAMPPIGLGMLKARLLEEGLACTIYDFNLDFLPLIDSDLKVAARLHDEIAYLWDFMPGEWLFSPSAQQSSDEAYLMRLVHATELRTGIADLLRTLRQRTIEFTDHCAAQVVAAGHDVVGLTSSFMQTQPSIALAARIKELAPDTKILFGGSNAFGPMGRASLAQFPVLDVVARGEADDIIVRVVRAVREEPGYNLRDIGGISFRSGDSLVESAAAESIPNVEMLPVPDYFDYFSRLTCLEAAHGPSGLPHFIPFETARGCWWGAKSHCTFCGLNADRMTFRSKSPGAALSLVRELRRRHGIDRFFAVDNIIDHSYYESLLTDLAREPGRLLLHYEIKSNVRRSHVQRLWDAGVTKVQPGIESLSTEILQLMRKGVTAIQNVRTLKLLTEYGMTVTWFILYGFPGERLEPYEQMARLIPCLMHLVPPRELAPVYLERFSPYHMNPQSFGIEISGPAEWYRHAFPQVPNDVLPDLSYRFDFLEPRRDVRINSFIESTMRPLIAAWKNRFDREGCSLSLLHADSGTTAVITGPLSGPHAVTLVDGLVAQVLRATDDLTSMEQVERAARGNPNASPLPPVLPHASLADALMAQPVLIADHRGAEVGTVSDVIDLLEERGLLMREQGRVLGLAVDRSRAASRLLLDQNIRSKNAASV